MSAMIDVRCPCGERFGWSGKFADRPPCPKCGRAVPKSELEAADARMAIDRALIAKHPRDATPAELRRMRELAGLNYGQAAKQLGWKSTMAGALYLRSLESGKAKLDPELADRMAEAYGCGVSNHQ